MGSINNRDGKLYLDFRIKGIRCREQTQLVDSAANAYFGLSGHLFRFHPARRFGVIRPA